MDFTPDELKPFFPVETESTKLEKLAELITVDSQTYYEQKEALDKEQAVDNALKGISRLY